MRANSSQFGQKAAWLWSIVFTIAIFAWFAASTDLASIGFALEAAGPWVIAIVVGMFTVNSMLLITWLNQVSEKRDSGRSAFRVAGWFMLATIVLPIRLGDVAWIYLMHRWLNLSPARAIFIGVYHRLMDFIFVCFFFLAACLISGSYVLGQHVWLLVALLLAGLTSVVVFLEFFLTVAARILTRLVQRTGILLFKVLLRQILQVRIWYRHSLPSRLLTVTIIIVAVRWALVIAGTTILIAAMVTILTWQNAFFAANGYVLMSIIPIHGLGGFGIGEASLAGILVAYGAPLGLASAVGLLIRMIINLVYLVIWLAMLIFIQITDRAGREVTVS